MKRNRLLLVLAIVVVLTMVLASCKCTHEEYTDWTITKDPTATATGTAERKCVKCGEPETKTIPELNDTSVWTKSATESVEPTHSTAGKDVYTSEYGTVTVPLDPIDHTFDQEVAEAKYLKDAATCTTVAVYYKSCSCGVASTTLTFNYGEVLGHDAHHHDLVPATCETDGTKEHWTCSREEGKYFTSEECTSEVEDGIVIGKLGHDAGEGVITVTTEPTLDAEGHATFTCVRENCPATDHIATLDLAKLSDTTVWTVNTTPADYEHPETTTYTHKTYTGVVIKLIKGEALTPLTFFGNTYHVVRCETQRDDKMMYATTMVGVLEISEYGKCKVVTDGSPFRGEISFSQDATTGEISWSIKGGDNFQWKGYYDSVSKIIVFDDSESSDVFVFTPYAPTNCKSNGWTSGQTSVITVTNADDSDVTSTIAVSFGKVYFDVTLTDAEGNVVSVQDSSNQDTLIIKQSDTAVVTFIKDGSDLVKVDEYTNGGDTLKVTANGKFVLGAKNGTYSINADETLDAYVVVGNQRVEHYTITLSDSGTYTLTANKVTVNVHYSSTSVESTTKDLFVGCVVDKSSLIPQGSSLIVGDIFADADYDNVLVGGIILSTTTDIYVDLKVQVPVTIHAIEDLSVVYAEGQFLTELLPNYVIGETLNQGRLFKGWSTDSAGEHMLAASAVATNEITDIYAQWQAPVGSSVETAEEIEFTDNIAKLEFSTTEQFRTYYHRITVTQTTEIAIDSKTSVVTAGGFTGASGKNNYGRLVVLKVVDSSLTAITKVLSYSSSQDVTVLTLEAGEYIVESHCGGKVTGNTATTYDNWGTMKLTVYKDTHTSALTAEQLQLVNGKVTVDATTFVGPHYVYKLELVAGKAYNLTLTETPGTWQKIYVYNDSNKENIGNTSSGKFVSSIQKSINNGVLKINVTETQTYYFMTNNQGMKFTLAEQQTVNVIYNLMVNGQENHVVAVTSGEKITTLYTIPSSVTNGDKVFGGWFTKDGTTTGDWGDEVTADTVVSEEMTVYAKWVAPHTAAGSYNGYNIYGASSTSKKTYSIDALGNMKDGTTVIGQVQFDESTGVGTVGTRHFYYDANVKAFAYANESNSSKFAIDVYYAFQAENVTVVSSDIISWNSNKTRVIKFTVDSSPIYVYINETAIYFNVTVTVTDADGAVVTDSSKYKTYGNTLIVSNDSGLTISKVYNGSAFVDLDGYQGTYSDTNLGQIKVDGIGKVTVNNVAYNYSIISEGTLSAVIDGQYYEISNMTESTCTATAFNANVTYTVEHGSIDSSVTLTPSINVEITLPTPVIEEGWMFFGWTDASGNKVSKYTFAKDETVTFTAVVLQPSEGQSIGTAQELTFTDNAATVSKQTTEEFQTYYTKFTLTEETDVTLRTTAYPTILGPSTSLSKSRAALSIVEVNGNVTTSKAYLNIDSDETTTVVLKAGTYYIECHVGGKVTGTKISASNQFDGWGSFTYFVYINTHSLPQTALTYELGTELVAAPSFGLTVCYEVSLVAGEYTFTMIEGEGDVFSKAYLYALNENTGALASSSTAVVNSTTAKTKTFSITKAGKYYITTDKACKFNLVLNQATDPSDINFAGKTFEKTEETSNMAGYYKHYYQVVFTSATEGYIKTYKEDIEWYQGPEEEVQVNFTAELDNGTITFKFSDGKADIVADYTETTIKFPSSCSISKMNGKTVTVK